MSADASVSGELPQTTAFGQLLRSLRTRALLSQEQLAQRSGLGVRTIRDMEGGRVSYPRGKSVQLLAVALGLDGEARRAFELSSRMPHVVALADRRMAPVTPLSALPAIEDNPLPAAAGYDVPAITRQQPARLAYIGWGVPAQLPMDTPVFAGRTAELAQLDMLVERAVNGPAVVIAAVLGGPGVGKTALAVHWTHRVGDRFPDGQLYVDLRGFDPHGPLSSAQAIRGLLGTLGVPSEDLPPDLHAQSCLYRSLLHGRRMLVLLDNARDVEQVRPLLPGAPGCLVVVTSRHQLTGLIAVEGAHPLTVGLLSLAEARELMARRLGRDRVRAELPAVDEIIERCARLPLALATFASRAAASPSFPLSTWAAELRDARGGLDAFDGDPSSDLRRSFSWSYHALSADAAQLFRLFGRGQIADLVPAAAATLAGLPERRVRVAFGELSQAHLTVERRPGTFATHTLLRAYAAELVRETTSGIDDPVSTEFRNVSSLARPRPRHI